MLVPTVVSPPNDARPVKQVLVDGDGITTSHSAHIIESIGKLVVSGSVGKHNTYQYKTGTLGWRLDSRLASKRYRR